MAEPKHPTEKLAARVVVQQAREAAALAERKRHAKTTEAILKQRYGIEE